MRISGPVVAGVLLAAVLSSPVVAQIGNSPVPSTPTLDGAGLASLAGALAMAGALAVSRRRGKDDKD
jgi:hypothetical protein